MKQFKLILLVLFLIQSSIFAQLEIKMSSDKKKYEYGENIALKCKITNTADTTFQFLAGSHSSCQAEFSFNNFNSLEHTACLTLSEWIIIEPHATKIYKWIIDPNLTGLPNKEGTQKIIGTFYFDLADTIYIDAPQFLGGQLNISYDTINTEAVTNIRDSLEARIINSYKFENRVSETWQIYGHQIDSIIVQYNNSEFFRYVEKNVFIEYESIYYSLPSNFYPLQIGNKWNYERYEVEDIMDPNSKFISVGKMNIEVIGDTIMSNGKEYFVLNEDFFFSEYIRKGYEGIYFYSPHDSVEYLAYDFSMEVIETVEFSSETFINVKLEHKGKDLFWGDSINTAYYYFDGLITLNVNLGKNIGPIYYYTAHHEPIKFKLLSYTIDGITYIDSTLVNVSESVLEIPNKFELSQNYPNPFNPTTTIDYNVPIAASSFNSSISLRVYNVLGQEITTLVNKKQVPGNYQTVFNASNLPSGIYYYSLSVNNFISTKKMILIK